MPIVTIHAFPLATDEATARNITDVRAAGAAALACVRATTSGMPIEVRSA